MGENKNYVFNFGSPDIEVVEKLTNKKVVNLHNVINVNQTGSGSYIDIGKDFLMVMYHPVTTEIDKLARVTRMLLKAVHEIDMPALWFWPNYDAGAERISHEMRVFSNNIRNHKIRFMRYLPPKDFLYLLKNTKCLIGNSSAGIKECSYLGIPVVDISLRQNKRLRSDNVLCAGSDKENLKKSVRAQIKRGRYPKSRIYQSSNTSKKISEKLAMIKLYTQKEFYE